MQALNLPSFDYTIKTSGASHYIYDAIRKKYILLTPEEWVRQHFVYYLINDLACPRSLIRLEQGLQYNSRSKRTDIIVYDRTITPLLLVECKAPHISLDHITWEQIARYNAHVKAHFLVMTNGMQHLCWHIDYKQGEHTLLTHIPPFDTLLSIRSRPLL